MTCLGQTALPEPGSEPRERFTSTGLVDEDRPAAKSQTQPGMRWIAGGTFRMGSDRHYPEEAPVHRVTVDGFWIDATPVTNRQFKAFVAATGHVTFAEIAPDPKDYPGALPHMLNAGSLVFTPPTQPVDLRDWSQWWSFEVRRQLAATLRPGQLDQRPRRSSRWCTSPIDDAEAYAAWAGKELPTEAEWEFAARGGLDGAEFAWGDELTPGGRHMANTWQGEFPHREHCRSTAMTAPRRSAPSRRTATASYDMIGNVWEWTTDWYAPKAPGRRPEGLLHPAEPARRARGGELRPAQAARSAFRARC